MVCYGLLKEFIIFRWEFLGWFFRGNDVVFGFVRRIGIVKMKMGFRLFREVEEIINKKDVKEGKFKV